MQILSNNKFILFLIAIILISLLLIPISWPKVKIQAYKMIRNFSKVHLALTTREYSTLTDSNFTVKYKSDNQESAQLILETGNEILAQVNRTLGYVNRESIPVIVYSSMEELNESFGWEGDRSPMGVYWMGSIRILTPEAWVEADEDKDVIFKNMGPMAHEYAHLVVDYKTNGNYTRWFTEGIAQYVEKEITGFTLEEPTQQAKENLYPFTELDQTYDEQANQELAYWQSLIAIEYLIDKNGEKIVNDLLRELNQGRSFNKVFKDLVGQDLSSFENDIRVYAKKK